MAELATLGELFSSAKEEEVPSVESIKNVLLTLCTIQRKLLTTVCRVFQLLLILPATNATSERSFSALRRIKSWLRSRMPQARLNHLMILHYHQDLTDSLDVKCIANEYVAKKRSQKEHIIANEYAGTAFLWDFDCRCFLKLTVASFQLQKPFVT